MSCGNFGDRGPLLQGDGAMGAGAVRGVLGLLHSCFWSKDVKECLLSACCCCYDFDAGEQKATWYVRCYIGSMPGLCAFPFAPGRCTKELGKQKELALLCPPNTAVGVRLLKNW